MIWQIVVLVGSILAISVGAVIYTKKAGAADEKKQYDERQEVIRGKACKYALCTTAICGCVYFIITYVTGKSFASDGVSALIMVFIGGSVASVYSIFNDSFFGLTERAGTGRYRQFMITSAIFVVCDGYLGIRTIADHELIREGLLTAKCLYPLLALYFLIILVSIGLKKYIDSRAERGEE